MRKLATAAAVSLALASSGAFGLGLGDIEMRSALNQPMNAEIRLSSVKPGELDGMIVQLASQDAFQRAGIERSRALTDLSFSVDSSGSVPVIRITSARPVVEPFLNFLLEVDWPAGRMVREYTVLLDPPVFMTPSASARSTAGDTPARIGGDAALVAPAPIERDTNAAVTDSFEVELVGDGAEVADSAVAAPADAGAGEVVSLDGLGASPGATSTEPLGDVALLPGDGAGEIVSLTDLGAPNTEAAARRAADAEFEVELVGGTEEIADDVVAGADGAPAASRSGTVAADAAGDGEIVSLEAIEPSAIGSGGADGGASAPDGDVEVAQGDTLFALAAERAEDGVSVQQMMLALLEANEAAFIDGNINLLRAGAVLRVPPADEARRVTQARALAEVGRQNDLWQDYRDNLRGAPTTRVARADTDATGPGATGGGDAVADAGDGDGELSESARSILEQARAEILNREELRIVAAEESSDGAAVAGNATDGDPAARAGAIDRRLQLAREELASTRLESEELGEQASELGGTAENLDALVTLRQNEVAALEARLAEARRGASGEDVAEVASNAVADAADAAGEAGADAANALADAGGAAADAAGDAAEATTDAAGAAVDAAQGAAAGAVGAVAGAAGAAGDAAGEAVADARNALTDAGRELEDVSLVGDAPDGADATAALDAGADAVGGAIGDAAEGAGDAAAATAAAAAAAADRPWYQTLMSDPARLAIAGVGGAALLGVLGTLLWRRRKRDDVEGFDEDDVHFIDEADAAEFRAQDDTGAGRDGLGSAAAGAGAAGLGAAAAGAAALGAAAERAEARETMSDDERDAFDDTAFVGGDDTAVDETQAFDGGARLSGAGAGADLGRDVDDGLDKDDTISEADVYLAYGLHGQAEELLGRAVQRDPDNALYARKLLDTYHAQGNAEAFHRSAADYHERFGGDGAPDWAGVAALGNDLRPGESLYAGAAGGIAAVGTGLGGAAFDDDEFGAGGATGSGPSATSRDFDDPAIGGGADASGGFDAEDETALMDQSLDPAFAFDESDLEATGDFSTIADEVAAESDEGVIEFAAFDDEPAAPRERPAAAEAMDSLDAPELSGGIGELDLSSSATAANEKLSGDRGPADRDAAPSPGLADDLTLDLDELSGELELDGTELLDGAVEDFEMPDLTADSEPLLGTVEPSADDGFGDVTTGFGGDSGDADEMDTMMDLAKAYIDMGDKDSASSALDEIVRSGTPDQVVEAETLLKKIS